MEPTNQNTPPQSTSPKKKVAPITIVVLLIVLVALTAGALYWANRNESSTSQPATSAIETTESSQAQISGEAEPSTLKADEVVNVSIYVDPGTEYVSAVGAEFTYTEDSLEFISIDNENSAFPTTALSSGGSGKVRIDAAIEPGTEPVTGKKLIAVVQFKALGNSGLTELAFTENTKVYNSEAKNILGTSPNIQITFEED